MTDKGSPHPFSGARRESDAALHNLHKDQLQASAIIAALRRAARDGDVSIDLTLNRVSFEWPDWHADDALFVFEAIRGKQP